MVMSWVFLSKVFSQLSLEMPNYEARELGGGGSLKVRKGCFPRETHSVTLGPGLALAGRFDHCLLCPDSLQTDSSYSPC
jgi:hypothetical protein